VLAVLLAEGVSFPVVDKYETVHKYRQNAPRIGRLRSDEYKDDGYLFPEPPEELAPAFDMTLDLSFRRSTTPPCDGRG
jgi:hypothetical protein